MNPTSVRKYLLYAIGEIILVVIGILIALQINNWAQYQKDRETERTYLMALREDLVSDTLTLNRIFRNIDQHITSAENLLAFIEQGVFNNELDMARDLISASWMSFFDANLSTYHELVNSGSLKLVRDKQLKEMLDMYNSYLQQIDKRYEWNEQTVWYDYGNYVREIYLDGRLFGSLYINEKEAIKQYSIDWVRLKKDRKLAKKLTYIISTGVAERRWHESTRTRVLEMIDHIDELMKQF